MMCLLVCLRTREWQPETLILHISLLDSYMVLLEHKRLQVLHIGSLADIEPIKCPLQVQHVTVTPAALSL
jgi:hypothetical protein